MHLGFKKIFTSSHAHKFFSDKFLNNTSYRHRLCLDQVDPRLSYDPYKILHLDL